MSSCPICHKNEYVKINKHKDTFIKFIEVPFMSWTLSNELILNFEVCSNCGIQFCINLEDYKNYKKGEN